MLFKRVFSRNKGFSLVELLTTIGILGVLAAVAIPYYLRYKEESIKVSMKSELSELNKSLNYAHSVDGGFHHSLLSMGYRPNRNLLTEAGFEYARGDTPDCPAFQVTDFTPFLTITADISDASKPESATRASQLCGEGYCVASDRVVTALPAQNAFNAPGSHAGCKTAFGNKSAKCDTTEPCDKFIIFARSKVRGDHIGRMYTNQDGVFGYSLEPDNPSDPHKIDMY